ncbi:hypothetical protein GEMRC1_004083 [Eukaryota sp. GEM-RC1]
MIASADEVSVMIDHSEVDGEGVVDSAPILLPKNLTALVAFITVTLAILCATLSDSISFILSLTGSLLGGVIVFIFPALCLLKSGAEKTAFDTVVAYSSFICGAFLSIVGTWSLFL